MTRGKEVGPDDTLVEVWKCLREVEVEFLTWLFHKILKSQSMPEERHPLTHLKGKVIKIQSQEQWNVVLG